jgi:hypothetical protein
MKNHISRVNIFYNDPVWKAIKGFDGYSYEIGCWMSRI